MTTQTQTFVVSPGAHIPYSLLTPQERSVLTNIVSNPNAANTKPTESGRFVSILTDGKRFLWDSPAEKTVRILSIIDGTYKPA